MYAQLGSTVFEGLFGWHEFEREAEARLAELDLINSKSDLQFTGLELDNISFGIRFHSSFCDPTLRYNELISYLENGEVLPLIDGLGNVRGDFVIHKVKQNVLHESSKGVVEFCECTVTLKEYADPDKTASLAASAQSRAFALDVRSPALIITGPPLSIAADLVKSAAVVGQQTALVSENIKNAATFTSKTADYLKRTVSSAQAAIAAAQDLQSRVENYGSIAVSGYTNIIDSVTAIRSNADALITSAEAGDLPNTLTNGTLFGTSASGLGDAMLPLTKLAILR